MVRLEGGENNNIPQRYHYPFPINNKKAVYERSSLQSPCAEGQAAAILGRVRTCVRPEQPFQQVDCLCASMGGYQSSNKVSERKQKHVKEEKGRDEKIKKQAMVGQNLGGKGRESFRGFILRKR